MTPHDPTILSLDIETYGACQKAMDGTALPQQTVFHPVKSLQIDGVPPQHLVLTCALTLVRGDYWNLPECQPADTMVLDMSLPDHRAILVSWLNHAQGTADISAIELRLAESAGARFDDGVPTA